MAAFSLVLSFFLLGAAKVFGAGAGAAAGVVEAGAGLSEPKRRKRRLVGAADAGAVAGAASALLGLALLCNTRATRGLWVCQSRSHGFGLC